MIKTFSDLPKVRKDEINKVARAVVSVFKDLKIDHQRTVSQIRQNLAFVYIDGHPETDSIFSSSFKAAYNANEYQLTDTSGTVGLSGISAVDTDDSYSISETGQATARIQLPVPTITDIELIAMSINTKSDGTFKVQTDKLTVIQPYNLSGINGIGSFSVQPDGFANSFRYMFVICKCYRRKHFTVKAGKPPKADVLVPHSGNVDGLLLLSPVN
jgi:hypothetical protein